MTSTPRESPARAQQDGVHLDDVAVGELRRAIAQGEVRPWYQPILRLATRELVGFEALARWHRPSGIVELPGAFIGLAEEAGLVTLSTSPSSTRRAADLARWRERRPDLRISVNFSARHLDDPGWVDTVHACTTRHGVPPGNIDVELTESARPRDLARGSEQLARLRELGYAVWFDDFGTGWSELTHLVDVPVDGIKIDRFFTERLGGRADAVVRALLRSPRSSASPPRSRASPPRSRRTGRWRSGATSPRATLVEAALTAPRPRLGCRGGSTLGA